MSETEQILDGFVESQGWTQGTVLDLALTYIENQASPEAWRDYLTSLAEVDNDIDSAQSDIRVSFTPQAWVNDNAIEVDAEGEREWFVSIDTADDLPGCTDLDWVTEDPFAPQWVKDWSGPFTISVVEA
jgi:hypothetical protein